jgi:hypothetical protein
MPQLYQPQQMPASQEPRQTDSRRTLLRPENEAELGEIRVLIRAAYERLEALHPVKNFNPTINFNVGSELPEHMASAQNTAELDVGAVALDQQADALLTAAEQAVRAVRQRGNEIEAMLTEIRTIRAVTAAA